MLFLNVCKPENNRQPWNISDISSTLCFTNVDKDNIKKDVILKYRKECESADLGENTNIKEFKGQQNIINYS